MSFYHSRHPSFIARSLTACALLCLSTTHPAGAQSSHAPHGGGRAGAGQPVSFSAEQVAHGGEIYAASCASCHGADLAGGHDVPDLGDYFVSRWANTPLDRLASAVAHPMPTMPPGHLPPQDTAALMAFILHHNGVTSATNAPLPMEDARLAKIRFPAPAPLPASTGGNP